MKRPAYLKTLSLLKNILDWKHPLNAASLQFNLIREAHDKGIINNAELAELTEECRA